jgi:hypothetical protein
MLCQKLAQQDPTNTDWQRELSGSLNRVANVLRAQGKPDQALAAYRFAFRPKNMAHHIFQSESELQNNPEATPKASPTSFTVSEKLARYGSSALSGVEHLTLLVGRKSVALALIRHFGSLKGLARASFQELRQFLPRRQAESVVAALSMSAIAETDHARSEQLDNPKSIYQACADIKLSTKRFCASFCWTRATATSRPLKPPREVLTSLWPILGTFFGR